MADPAIPRCNTCPYWEPMTDELGNCRALPPALPPTVELIWWLELADPWSGVWPSTDRSEFCGRHPDFPAYLAAWRDGHSEV